MEESDRAKPYLKTLATRISMALPTGVPPKLPMVFLSGPRRAETCIAKPTTSRAFMFIREM